MNYRDYEITYYAPPIPIRNSDWQYVHEDYDGPPDPRCGHAGSVEEAKELIDEIYEEAGDE